MEYKLPPPRPHRFWPRLWASIIDGFFFTLLFLLIYWLLNLVGIAWFWDNYQQNTLFTQIEMLVIGAIVVVCLAKFGKTPGKYLLGLKVYANDDGPLTWQMAIKRHGFFILIPTALSWIIIPELGSYDLDADLDLPWLRLFILYTIMAVFYFRSFIVWRGQTYWDRFAGTYVEKV